MLPTAAAAAATIEPPALAPYQNPDTFESEKPAEELRRNLLQNLQKAGSDLQRHYNGQTKTAGEGAPSTTDAPLAAFEEVVKSTAAAVFHLEGVYMRRCYDVAREAAESQVAMLRHEVGESTARLREEIAELRVAGLRESFSNRFSGDPGRLGDEIFGPRTLGGHMHTARDRSGQLNPEEQFGRLALDVLINADVEQRNSLEQGLLEERETRVRESAEVRARLDTVEGVAFAASRRLAALTASRVRDRMEVQAESIHQQLESLRSEVSEMRLCAGEPASFNHVSITNQLFEDLNTLRTDVCTAVTLAGEAVHLVECLAVGLNTERHERAVESARLHELLRITPSKSAAAVECHRAYSELEGWSQGGEGFHLLPSKSSQTLDKKCLAVDLKTECRERATESARLRELPRTTTSQGTAAVELSQTTIPALPPRVPRLDLSAIVNPEAAGPVCYGGGLSHSNSSTLLSTDEEDDEEDISPHQEKDGIVESLATTTVRSPYSGHGGKTPELAASLFALKSRIAAAGEASNARQQPQVPRLDLGSCTGRAFWLASGHNFAPSPNALQGPGDATGVLFSIFGP